MKRKQIISSAISFVLLLSMTATFTACGDNKDEATVETTEVATDEVADEAKDEISLIDENLVDYKDPSNGVSYTYDSSYILSVDDEVNKKEISDGIGDEDFANQLAERKNAMKAIYENVQYYLIRNEKNELRKTNATLCYIVDDQYLESKNIAEISDEDYQFFSDTMEETANLLGENVQVLSSEKYITFGENEYMHLKYSFEMKNQPFVYEQFIFQAENGDIAKFILTASKDDYDFAFSQVTKTLESLIIN